MVVRRWDEPPETLPSLGLTYHAGEDFNDPIDGLRAIAGLVRHLLSPGDRIGHGLALGLDVAAIARTRRSGPLPAGLALDNLVWLRQQAKASRLWDGSHAVRIDEAIDRLTREIYSNHHPSYELERAMAERFTLPASKWKADADAARRIAWADAFDPKVRAHRERNAGDEAAKLLRGASSLVSSVQKEVALAVREAGVTLEFTPSSNLATGVVGDCVDHPYFRCREMFGGRGAHRSTPTTPASSRRASTSNTRLCSRPCSDATSTGRWRSTSSTRHGGSASTKPSQRRRRDGSHPPEGRTSARRRIDATLQIELRGMRTDEPRCRTGRWRRAAPSDGMAGNPPRMAEARV